MAVTPVAFTMAIASLADKLIDLDSDTVSVMLMSAYTPAKDTHQFLSQVKAAGTEASGTGYTAGGKALTTKTWTRTGSVYSLNADPVEWATTAGSLAAAYAVFYDSTPSTDETRPVLGYWDLGGTQTSSNGTFKLTPHADGFLTITAS